MQFANEPDDTDGYRIGEEIQVTATFSERVWVAGGPVLNLQVGDDLRTMTYYPLVTTNASGTVDYLPSTDGLSVPSNAFSPMGAVIDYVARNEVVAIEYAAIDTDDTRLVGGVRATITNVEFISMPTHTSGSVDTYVQGDEIAVELTFSEPEDTFPDGALVDLEFTLVDSSTVTRQMVADGVTSTTTVVFRYTVTDHDLGTDMKIPEDPFGSPIPDLLDQVTASTTLADLLINSPSALNIVDKVSDGVELQGLIDPDVVSQHCGHFRRPWTFLDSRIQYARGQLALGFTAAIVTHRPSGGMAFESRRPHQWSPTIIRSFAGK